MKLLSFLFRYSRRTAVLAVLAGVAGGACNTALMAIINSSLSDSAGAARGMLGLFVGLGLLLPLTRFVSEWLLLRLGQDAMMRLRMHLGRQILAAPLRPLEEVGAPRLLATLTDDIPSVANALLIVPVLCIDISVVVGSLVYLGWLSWQVLLAVLCFIAVGVASYQLPIVKAVGYLRSAREQTDALMKHFRALTDGAKEFKLHRGRREAFLDKVLEPTAASFRRHSVRGMTIYTAAGSWGQTLGFLVIGLLVFGLPGVYPVSGRVLIGYVFVLLFMLPPLQTIMNMLPSLSRANVAVKKVEKLGLSLDAYAGEEESDWTQPLPPFRQRLELKGVRHTYHVEGEEDSFTLGPIDLSFRPGELVFLTGGNGSGKTTLAKLLVGLYEPEAGELRLDGRPIDNQNRDRYRQHFSAVFSDFCLFESLLGIEAPNLEGSAREYLSRLQLAHKVQIKDGGVTTLNLSQGQRKRLALLTAYLEDRPVYLFDEWAADQDPAFKQVFYHQLLPELKAKGKTVFVISHDDQYYHVSDRLIKLDYGKVEYDRPPSELHAPMPEATPVPLDASVARTSLQV
jgi:putative pyoverdin transport system ATP-binding/permease protein